jgi:hypothetical protein
VTALERQVAISFLLRKKNQLTASKGDVNCNQGSELTAHVKCRVEFLFSELT